VPQSRVGRVLPFVGVSAGTLFAIRIRVNVRGKMSVFPKVDSQFHQERAGVNAVARITANLGLIWRENQIKDVGIDGQIEYVTLDGHVTGRLVAVQVKSGESYFKHEDGDSWKFYPEEKHRLYWERFPIPVILVLHNPITDQLAWIDVRQELRSGVDGEPTAIRIPKKRSLATRTLNSYSLRRE